MGETVLFFTLNSSQYCSVIVFLKIFNIIKINLLQNNLLNFNFENLTKSKKCIYLITFKRSVLIDICWIILNGNLTEVLAPILTTTFYPLPDLYKNTYHTQFSLS